MRFMTPIVDRLLVSLGMWLATGPIPSFSPLRIEAPDPALLQILQEWETASSKFRRLDCSFKRFVYDDTFEVEKRAVGELAIESPNRLRYVLRSGFVKSGEVSRKKNSKGEAFKIVADVTERWHWTGTKVFMIDEKSRTYQSIAIPEEERTIIPFVRFSVGCYGPLTFVVQPFVVGMPADQMIRRFRINLVQKTETEVWLDFEPRLAGDIMNYKKARVILDRQLMVPKAMQMIDPTGHKVTVHTFSNVRINPANPPPDDLGEPNLEGFRLNLIERAAAKKPAETAK